MRSVLNAAVLALGVTIALAESSAKALPHGLLPRRLSEDSLAIHNAAVGAAGQGKSQEADACGARLAHLRELVESGRHADALEMSMALHEFSGSSSVPSHADCHADAVHVGEGTISTKIASPHDRDSAAAPVVSSFIKLHASSGGAGDAKAVPVAKTHGDSRVLRSATRAPVRPLVEDRGRAETKTE